MLDRSLGVEVGVVPKVLESLPVAGDSGGHHRIDLLVVPCFDGAGLLRSRSRDGMNVA
jgi:hypothetical protein